MKNLLIATVAMNAVMFGYGRRECKTLCVVSRKACVVVEWQEGCVHAMNSPFISG